MKTPVIGITLDCEDPGVYSKFSWYALRRNYAGAVARAGGVPIALPHEADLVETYLSHMDGLVVTGGNFDLDPALFGDTKRHRTVKTKDARTDFEMALSKGALARDMPVLGICGGQQLLHVALGGTLIQHIPDEIPNALAHEQPNPRDEAGHEVEIVKGSLLHDIVGLDVLPVNSAHHQAVKDEPDGVRINARAPDGVIEGMEATNKRFCLGVQWHPEIAINDGDTRLFAAFVDAARKTP